MHRDSFHWLRERILELFEGSLGALLLKEEKWYPVESNGLVLVIEL